LARTTYNDVLRVGVCPKMRPVGVTMERKKDRNFHASNWLFARTTHVDVAPWNSECRSCPGSSYIFKVSWKSVEGSQSCRGRKSAAPIDKAHGLYNNFYYRTSRDSPLAFKAAFVDNVMGD